MREPAGAPRADRHSREAVAAPRGAYLGRGQFYGDVLRPRECADVTLSELRHAGRRRLPEHSHAAAYFCLLLEGDYREQVGPVTVTYEPFTLAFHPPAMTHRDEIGSEGGRFFSVELHARWLEELAELGGDARIASDPHGLRSDAVWLATSLYREYRAFGARSPLAVEALVLEMLAHAARARIPDERRPPAWMARAVELVHESVGRPVTVREVAAATGVHPVHLARVFRRQQGQTLAQYLFRLRVRAACRALARPDAELAAVALECGFADQSHFTRIFKRVTGATPSAFRRAVFPADARR